jgi:hypothetical protein
MTEESEKPEKDYSTTWLPDSLTEIKLGGKWATRIGLIKTADGETKLRVAKGRYKNDGSFSQVQKFNIKWAGELESIITALLTWRGKLPKKESQRQ